MVTRLGDGPQHLIHAISYEKRGLTSLRHILDTGKVGSCALLEFPVAKYLSTEQQVDWNNQRKETLQLLSDAAIAPTPHKVTDRGPERWRFLENQDGEHPLLVNITVLPKIFIMSLYKRLIDEPQVFYYYQSCTGATATPPKLSRVALTRTVPVPGFEGIPEVDKPEHAIVFLGYEGLRASQALKHVSPGVIRITGIIGMPTWAGHPFEKDEDSLTNIDRHYLYSIRKANANLLDGDNVEEAWFNSLDPEIVRRQLHEVAKAQDDAGRGRMFMLPHGTKAQALGAAAFGVDREDVQAFYGVPNMRPTVHGDSTSTKAFTSVGGSRFRAVEL